MPHGPLIYDELYAEDGLAASLRCIAELIPAGSRVLDVGCASGYFGEHLIRTRGCTVAGVDVSEEAVAVARERGVDAVRLDLEREPLDVGGVDVVVFADVLEHVRNPLDLLRAAAAAPRVLVSLPNIAHWSARRQVARGRFPHDEHGLFDRTHVRFYTRATARELLEQAGLRIVSETWTVERLPKEDALPGLRRLREPLARRWPELFAFQFVYHAVA